MIDPKFFGSSTLKGFFVRSMVVTEVRAVRLPKPTGPTLILWGVREATPSYGMDLTRFENQI